MCPASNEDASSIAGCAGNGCHGGWAGSGLRRLPLREAVPPPFHLPQEEQEEEGHGLLLLLYGRQVLPRAP